jgi:enoyl-CoA hydratase
MSPDVVLYDSQERVATITLNRPDKLNALSNAMVAELRDALIHFEASGDRVAVLTGAGERAFTAGADLRDPPRDPELWECMP